MAQADWMAAYQGRTLGELHLPGSHDAGTSKDYIDLTAAGTKSNAATQSLTITQQLMAGTRFFDLRLAEHGGKVVAHHTTAGQGAFSKLSVNRVLESAALWCSVHRTEVVIFRISHTSSSTNAHEIVKASGAGSLHTGTGNLCTKTLKNIVSQGGGLICILDEGKFSRVISQTDGVHGYTKHKSHPENLQGISTCGCYGSVHSLKKVVQNGLKGQYEHNEKHNHNGSHLWQLYWQKTYVNPMSRTGIEDGSTKVFSHTGGGLHGGGKVHGGTHASIDYMLGKMKGLALYDIDYEVQKKKTHREGILRRKVVDRPSIMYSTRAVRNYTLPNIISYDFVNEKVNQIIIKLNEQGMQQVADG